MQVPPATHPSWSDLLTGKKAQQPAFMAARMFIVRCRMELTKNKFNADEVRKSAAQLRDLYVKNADCPSVKQDLATLLS
jgi:hypothetical protein